MAYDINYINVDVLKNLLENLTKEYESFNTITYNKNNYINTCTDPFIKSISLSIDNLYKEIGHDYLNIINWFENYIKNLYSLESYLADNGRLGAIGELELRSFVDYKLPSLEIYFRGV